MSKTFSEKILDGSVMLQKVRKIDWPYDPDISPFIETPNGIIFAFRKKYTVRALDDNMSLSSLHDLAMEGWPEEIVYDLEHHMLSKAEVTNKIPQPGKYNHVFLDWGSYYRDLDPAILQKGHYLSKLDQVDGVVARLFGIQGYISNVKGFYLVKMSSGVLSNVKFTVNVDEKERKISLDLSCFAGFTSKVKWESSVNSISLIEIDHNSPGESS